MNVTHHEISTIVDEPFGNLGVLSDVTHHKISTIVDTSSLVR